MGTKAVKTEIILSQSNQSLGQIQLESKPLPGEYIEIQGQAYCVLECHHHYQYRVGGYHLCSISLYVQIVNKNQEANLLEGNEGCFVLNK